MRSVFNFAPQELYAGLEKASIPSPCWRLSDQVRPGIFCTHLRRGTHEKQR